MAESVHVRSYHVITNLLILEASGLCLDRPLLGCALRPLPSWSLGSLPLPEVSASAVAHMAPDTVSWLYLLTTARYIGRRVRKHSH